MSLTGKIVSRVPGNSLKDTHVFFASMTKRPQSSSNRIRASQIGKPKYLEAVFNLPLKASFTYEIPARFRGLVDEGMRVVAPFGRRQIIGYVVSFSDRPDPLLDLKKIKCIEGLPDRVPVISA